MAMAQGLFSGSQGSLNSVPAPVKQTLSTNYIDFRSGSDAAGINDWRQQYLPELMAAEAEVFGNRTISGFLSQVGAEEAMTSDQVVWSEQGRLHLRYSGALKGANGTLIDGLPSTHAIRVGDTVIVASAAANKTVKCYVTHTNANSADATDPFGSVTVGATEIKVLPYSAATLQAAGITADNDPLEIFVYGSEFAKGKNGRTEVITPKFESFSNKPVIMKEKYEISGSDAAQIGWVEVSGEDGQSGFMWYLKAQGDTTQRFADNCEMVLVEA